MLFLPISLIHLRRGLWGIKHTRKPVDDMVADAK